VNVVESIRLWKPRTYKGTVSVDVDPDYTTRLRLINEVDLEEYVASVLPREYPFEDVEGSKAMAVVIRTYALQSKGRYGADYDHTDHIGSQVYDGSAHVTAVAREAARSTEGLVLTYKGELAEATHSAASGGYTANNEDVWKGPPLPYLRAKPDPYDVSPHRTWTSSVPRMQLLGVLTATYGGGKRVDGFTPQALGPDGRVRSIRINVAGGTNRTISSNEFRLLINRHFGVNSLKSTMFSVRQSGDAYVFEGSGFGHGVGLSQWGAHEMAERGRSYEDILTFYFTGVDLSDLSHTMAAEKRENARVPVVRASGWGSAEPAVTDDTRAGW
jgi:stage II sporulation protein D